MASFLIRLKMRKNSLGIITLFLYTFIFKSEPTGDEADEELEAVPFQRVAFWMGILIMLCAAALK
jgi:hypothetical protein